MNATLFVVCATFAAFRDALVNPNITHIAWNGTMLVSESVAVRGTKTLECVTGGYGCALDFSNGHSLELPHASSRVTATSIHFENVWHAADASTPPYIVVSNGGGILRRLFNLSSAHRHSKGEHTSLRHGRSIARLVLLLHLYV